MPIFLLLSCDTDNDKNNVQLKRHRWSLTSRNVVQNVIQIYKQQKRI